MGIQGLLPYLKKASRGANISEFKGCTVAIDVYCWLHRGAFACAEKLAVGEKTDQYVYYCLKYINHLISLGIKPVLVFDGCHLPSKKEVETSRRERRETYRKKAAQFLREGRRSEARDCFTKCIDITPQMALELMNAAREKGVDCIVAPYEADAQLAYLSKIGVAQVIITEDSDLVLFGCEKVMFKMDTSGNGVLIERRHLNTAMDLRPDAYTFEKFRYMCILSGCDYLPSLPGIGLAKANKVFKLTRQTDMNVVVKKLPATLNMSSLSVNQEYIEGFHKANNTFLYQLVYDPLKKKLIPLNPYTPEVDRQDLDYAGPPISSERALQIALGNIDIYTGKMIGDFDPETFKPKYQSWKHLPKDARTSLHMLSIWDKNYRPMSKIGQHNHEPELRKQNTQGQEVTIAVPKAISRPIPKILKRPREEDTVSEEDLLSAYQSEDTKPTPEKRIKRVSDILPIYDLEPSIADTPPDFSTPQRPTSQDMSSVSAGNASPITSPSSEKKRRNIFACGDKNQKVFSLNVKKEKNVKVETKSRFFSSKVPLKPTDFFGELDKSHETIEKGLVSDSEESDSGDESDDEPKTMKNVKQEEIHENIVNQNNSSPPSSQTKPSMGGGSFGFSKKVGSSILERFRNTSDKYATVLKDQFKPVKPKQSSVADYVKPSASESNMEYGTQSEKSTKEEDEDVFQEEVREDFPPDSAVSHQSSLYSIDSFSHWEKDFSDSTPNTSQKFSQNTSLNTSAEQSESGRESIGSSYFSGTNNSGIERKSFGGTSSQKLKKLSSAYNSVPNLSSTYKSAEVKTPASFLSPSSKSGTGNKSTKLLGGARASGLSKSTSKKAKPTKPNDENQPTMMNFFNDFSRNKSSTEKIESTKSKKVLSPHKDTNNIISPQSP